MCQPASAWIPGVKPLRAGKIGLILALLVGRCMSQDTSSLSSQLTAAAQGSRADASLPVITFDEALARAKAINPQFQSAVTAAGLAHQDVVQTRAALLPNASYTMGEIFTESQQRGTNNPIFIANNGVHEYIAQGNVHEALSLTNFADYSRAAAAQAVARAKSEIALRGLVVTVAQAYYGYLATQRKFTTAQRANDEAQRFLDISQKLEQGGEVAHSDVIKAQLQAQQIQRDLRESELEMNKSRLELAVLIFRDYTENFNVADDLAAVPALPTFDEVKATGEKNNPDLRAAQAAVRQASREVTSAWGGMLPSFAFDYWYGIDANQFAVNGPDNIRNLGSAAAATMDLPIWTWGANLSKVKQANLQKKQAVVELTAAQRTLLASIRTFYDEAQTALTELDLLRSSEQLATESLRLINMRYQGGESTVLEVVDAQNALTAVSNAYADGQVRFRMAMANLQTLTGKL